ncbi:MAG: pabB [Rhodocyclales bacterium]|nr:pabB [Rhodocyclales bacterium]
MSAKRSREPGSAALQPFALFEDNLGQAGSGVLLQEHLLTLDCTRVSEADAFFATLDQYAREGRWIALVADYELGSAFEPSAAIHSDSHSHSPSYLARALVFSQVITLDGPALADWWQHRLGALTAQEHEAGVLHLSPALNCDAYAAKAQRVLAYIEAGDCYQVNLSFPMTGSYFGHPLALYSRLRETQPVRHGALICDGNEWLLSRSPELFFERSGHTITCRPMKGTAPRGATPHEDAINASTLQHSEKNRAENLMIVDLIRNDLGRLAKAGDVHVRQLFELESYATVFQLTSTVEAAPVVSSLGEIFRALFPCGSVTGAPKVRAMQIIHVLENQARGPYCGAIGWITPNGDCSFNVPIRTLRLQTDNKCRMDVGSGIVADSEPASEYDECLTKARFVTDDGLQLIETLRCEIYRNGDESEPFPLIAWHLQRLERSARALGFKYDEDAVRNTLLVQAAALPLGLQRVRLLLSRDGMLECSSAPLGALPPDPTLVIAAERLDPEDPRLQHKTTARRFYDVALQDATAAGHFDVIYLNTREEICEGARSNIFIERDDHLLTPPLSSGLLPGVMRAQLLAAGSASETVLTLDDLVNAERIFVGNALRGLVETRLIGR